IDAHEIDVHDHNHKHKHKHVHALHRGLAQILAILDSGNLTEGARAIAARIFDIIAQAEAKVHGTSVEQVHFHEVGAVDSIVDIVSAAVCLDNLGITRVIVPELYEGHGTVRCQHGIIPVPVPAVSAITQMHGLRLHLTDTQGELVTPTGAAIAAAIKTDDSLPESFVIEKTGMGAGKRIYPGVPGILRAMLIQDFDGTKDHVFKLESNIDDSSGEMLGYVMERLFQAGARDVNYTPVFMKKNRPAYQLNIICDEKNIPALEQIIFEETTTIGIRRQKMERTVLEREGRIIDTPLGKAQMKICRTALWERAYPEYGSAVELARENRLPLQEVYRVMEAAWRQQTEDTERRKN
ncbi:MAG: nickel pincer cofactor biosynthesis protein LarC, partial [Lachnospiraceae bacterium]|nr:nickel pincer cofactor biosynthesis protein LarC [Lachnospiraceae bacterium]